MHAARMACPQRWACIAAAGIQLLRRIRCARSRAGEPHSSYCSDILESGVDGILVRIKRVTVVKLPDRAVASVSTVVPRATSA